MINNIETIYLESPESSRFVSMVSTTATQYMLYNSSSSLLPNSLDQIIKNNILPVYTDSSQVFEPVTGESQS